MELHRIKGESQRMTIFKNSLRTLKGHHGQWDKIIWPDYNWPHGKNGGQDANLNNFGNEEILYDWKQRELKKKKGSVKIPFWVIIVIPHFDLG